MFDPITLAASVVAALTPLLSKALDKGVEKLGESAAGTLFDKLKKSLGHDGAKGALDDLAKQPGDADAQAALRMQLRKALEADPRLAAQLQEWLAAAQPLASQNVTGDSNKAAQVVGNNNTISIG
jgi:hypothetical protein